MKLDTEVRYALVANRVLLRFEKETDKSWRLSLPEFLHWFYEKSPYWSKSTFRQYKASLRYFLDIYGTVDSAEEIREMSQRRVMPTKARTSQLKDKKLSKKDLMSILSWLKSSKSGYKDILAGWLFSGVITGVRPIEWHEARLIKNENGVFLVIRNAKFSNSRSNGEYRTLNLSALEYSEIEAIQRHVDNCSILSEREFMRLQTSCSNLLYYATRRIFKGRKKFPTLYSARHQFSADAKQTMPGMSEVAALMGHASSSTATEHYGKRSNYQQLIKIVPMESEVATVRTERFDKGQKRMAQRKGLSE